MATPNLTEEEVVFRRRARRRLVGAVVLVVIAVAIVPMILPEKRPQQDTQQIDIRIPAQDASGYAPRIVAAPAPAAAAPLAESKPTTPAPLPEAVPAAPAEAPKAEPVSEPKAAAAAVVEKAAPVAKAAAAAKPAADSKQSYFVQYGAFSELKNAKQRQADLKAKGITTFTEVVQTAAGDKIRVRSGPYTAREQAEKIRTKVKPLDSKLVVAGANG